MDYYYDISGVSLCVINGRPFKDDEYNAFKTDKLGNADIVLEILDGERGLEQEITDAVFVFHDGLADWYKTKGGGLLFRWRNQLDGSGLSLMATNRDFSRAKLCWGNNRSVSNYFEISGEILFRNYLIYRGGMVMHAVSTYHNGEAILFSGPSGEGKSTQADLWIRYEGAHIINGDRSPLVFVENKLETLGSAWSGSSGIYRNERAPVKAIVFIEQAKENTVKKLTPQEALRYMIPRSCLPYYDENMMNQSFQNIDRVLRSADAYLLRNKADKDCVALLKEAVYG